MHSFDNLTSLAHHAYALVGAKIDNLLHSLEKNHSVQIKANPDFFHEKYEVLGIDESRKIKELHASKSFVTGSKRIFIIETNGITHEAQNSLLKIFEEPHEFTHFFILIPSASFLLPTLRSRLLIIEEQRGENEELKEVKSFLKLSTKDKIAYVDDIAKDISDEKIEKSDAVKFLAALEMILAEDVQKNQKGIKAVLKARDYMNDRSPSIKQLLEFVALSL